VVRAGRKPPLPFEPDYLLAIVTALDDSLAVAAREQIRHFSPDVIHCHDWMTTRAGNSAAAAANAPLIATVHATEWGRHQGYLGSEISRTVDSVERFLCRSATGLIACSQAMQSEVSRQFGVDASKVAVIPNGVDTAQWTTTAEAKADARTRWAPHGPLLTYSGRLEAEKGIFTMLDAMPMVLNAFPRTRLVVAGSGGQSDRFDAEVERRGLAGSVVRTGWLPEDDLRALVGSADAALVPSLYEPFGLVALEAMSLGAPVICGRTGGLVDIVDDGVTGLLFTPGDAASLTDAIGRTLNDPEASRSRAAAALGPLHDRFNWPTIAAATTDVYAAHVAAVSDQIRDAG
jgi:glycogen(starch) synthase